MCSHTYLCPSSRTYYHAHTHTHAYTHTPSHTLHILATRSSCTLLLKNVRLTHFITKNSQCICLVQIPLVSLHVCQFSLGLPCHSQPPRIFVLSLFLRLRVKNWNLECSHSCGKIIRDSRLCSNLRTTTRQLLSSYEGTGTRPDYLENRDDPKNEGPFGGKNCTEIEKQLYSEQSELWVHRDS